MKNIITLLALAFCVTSGIAQTTRNSILPEAFDTYGAATSEKVQTLFSPDGIGMFLVPNRRGPNYEVSLEVVGHTALNPSVLIFGVSQAVFSGEAIVNRIEMFNYTTKIWDVVAWASTAGPAVRNSIGGRPYRAPSTFAQVKSADYINSATGEVRTRVFWTSAKPFGTVWVDFAGWQLSN